MKSVESIDCPCFMDFLDACTGGDQRLKEVIRDIVGEAAAGRGGCLPTIRLGGEPGSGKTTLMCLLRNLHEFSRGEFRQAPVRVVEDNGKPGQCYPSIVLKRRDVAWRWTLEGAEFFSELNAIAAWGAKSNLTRKINRAMMDSALGSLKAEQEAGRLARSMARIAAKKAAKRGSSADAQSLMPNPSRSAEGGEG